MASPPFLPDETKPGASDLISLYPTAEQAFRDIIETWILVQHNTTGTHKQVTLDDIATPTIIAAKVGLWHESGVLKTRFAAGTVYNVLTTNTGMPLAGGTMTGDLVLAGAPDADLKAATKKYVDDQDAAALVSPALTGDPTAPTQSVGNDSTRIATTAFVAAAGITRYNAVATTSGTAHGIGSIPAGTNRISVMLNGISLSGSNSLLLRLGDVGGIEATDYVSTGSTDEGNSPETTGFRLNRGAQSADAWSGLIIFTRQDGNTWVAQGSLGYGGGGDNHSWNTGIKTLSGELTQVSLTRTGSNTFDAGSFSIMTEV